MLSPSHEHRSSDPRGTTALGPERDPSILSAQQTNLVRVVIRGADLVGSSAWDAGSGRKTVRPLEAYELTRFRAAWQTDPVRCIRAMNEAIGALTEPGRVERYLEAAFDLEILMDREQQCSEEEELIGVPLYLNEGYTDFPLYPETHPHRRRKMIYVDKARLRNDLVDCKRRIVANHNLQACRALLCEIYVSLRQGLDYDEADPKRRHDGPVLLSESVSRREVGSRHLAILYQLRLQEAGVSSRLVKGTLQLFALKLRHAWNVVQARDVFALVDVAFAEDDTPFVLCGKGPEEVYREAVALNRTYRPSPESSCRYGVLKAPPPDVGM